MKDELIISLAIALIEDAIEKHEKEHVSLRGPRGQKGSSGKDFNYEEHKDKIKSELNTVIESERDNLKLKFDDLKEEEINSLVGPRGRDGRDGKDFSYEEHQDSIYKLLNEVVESKKEELQLRIENLNEEELALITGPEGKSFIFDENKDHISILVEGFINEIKEDLKLKFNDLSEEEKLSLRGSRGQRGKEGKGFEFEEHKENINVMVNDFISGLTDTLKLKFKDLTEIDKEELKLKFEHLTEDEKSGLKLKFEDLTENDKAQLKGARGSRGQKGSTGEKGDKGDTVVGPRGVRGAIGPAGLDGTDGKDGIDGTDGKDAPVIIDIRIKKDGKNKFYFEFEYNDGATTRTNSVSFPKISETVMSMYGFVNIIKIQKDGVALGIANTINYGDGIAVDLEDGVANVRSSVARSSSPGYTWGRMGDLSDLTWLFITGSVPSNKAGLPFGLVNGGIEEISVANEIVGNFVVGLYEHEGDGVNLTQLGTVEMINQRVGTFTVDFPVTQGRQLAARVESGAARNLGIFAVIRGDAP